MLSVFCMTIQILYIDKLDEWTLYNIALLLIFGISFRIVNFTLRLYHCSHLLALLSQYLLTGTADRPNTLHLIKDSMTQLKGHLMRDHMTLFISCFYTTTSCHRSAADSGVQLEFELFPLLRNYDFFILFLSVEIKYCNYLPSFPHIPWKKGRFSRYRSCTGRNTDTKERSHGFRHWTYQDAFCEMADYNRYYHYGLLSAVRSQCCK